MHASARLTVCSPKYNYQRQEGGEYVFQKSTGKVLAIRQNNAFVQSATAGDGGSQACVAHCAHVC